MEELPDLVAFEDAMARDREPASESSKSWLLALGDHLGAVRNSEYIPAFQSGSGDVAILATKQQSEKRGR